MLPGFCTGMLLGTQAAGGTPFSPLDLPSLNRWYDPSDSSTVTLVSSAVSQINDKSGNAYDASQATSGNRPIIGSINGLDALLFDGVNDRLTSTLGLAPFSGSDQPFTLFTVIDLGADLSGARDFFSLWRSTSTSPVHVVRSFSNAWDVTRRDDASTAVSATPATNHSGSPHLVTVIFHGTTLTLRVDGDVASNAVPFDAGTITLDTLTIGAFRTTFNFFLGAIGEMILCAADLGSTDVGNAEAYLASKWGITL